MGTNEIDIALANLAQNNANKRYICEELLFFYALWKKEKHTDKWFTARFGRKQENVWFLFRVCSLSYAKSRENIAKVIAPLAKNMAAFKKLVAEVDESDDQDKMAMFADALPKQQKMLMQSGLLIIPFFRQLTWPLLKPEEQSSFNYLASAWCALENMLLAATAEGLGTVFHIPVSDEAEKIKKIVNAPEGYEFTCLLTMGYPAENAFLPKQKEINAEDRIHLNSW